MRKNYDYPNIINMRKQIGKTKNIINASMTIMNGIIGLFSIAQIVID